MSEEDIDIKKCDKKLLPTGTAAGAQVLGKFWLSGIEKEVRAIREQNEKQSYVLPNGDIIVQYKNVKRIIRLN